MPLDAIILTGGRSSRLNSAPKSEFIFAGSTIVARTLDAARHARRIVIVGTSPTMPLPVGVSIVREEPPFGGPVAAIAAGLDALGVSTVAAGGASGVSNRDATNDAVLVLACDMPHIGLAVPPLIEAFTTSRGVDGVLAVDEAGRRQPLAAVYRAGALRAALAAAAANSPGGESFAGLPVFRVLEHLVLVDLDVPSGSTDDVDTWEDAERLGALPPMAR